MKNLMPCATSLEMALFRLSRPLARAISFLLLAVFFGCSSTNDEEFLTSFTKSHYCVTYTSTNGSKIDFSGCERNVYENGKGTAYLKEPEVYVRTKTLKTIELPSWVTSIGYQAFYNCSRLTSITIPSSVTWIGYQAFYYCSSLTSITIPSSVTSIGSQAFGSCSSLTSITIPSSVTSIGSQAFSYCSSLTSITIPSSVTSIEYGAFEYCSSLKNCYCSAKTPPTLRYSNIFYKSGITNIYVPTASVSAYKSATGWSAYASMIQGYSF
jgi:hypothetical protein